MNMRIVASIGLVALALFGIGCASTDRRSTEAPVPKDASSGYFSPEVATMAAKLASDLAEHPEPELAKKVIGLADGYYKPEPPDIEFKVDSDTPYVVRMVTGYTLSADQRREWVVHAFSRIDDERVTVRLENREGDLLASYGPEGMSIED